MNYVPERGDIVWIDFDPQLGREQAKRRPALILTPRRYNEKAGMAIVCPITSKAKGRLFDVPITDGLPVSGVIISDQVKSLDFEKRNAAFICCADPLTLETVIERLATLLDI
jgi:mRNA interferase MazF